MSWQRRLPCYCVRILGVWDEALLRGSLRDAYTTTLLAARNNHQPVTLVLKEGGQ
jgi:hypothetical protein